MRYTLGVSSDEVHLRWGSCELDFLTHSSYSASTVLISRNFNESINRSSPLPKAPKKKFGVLISGTGTNLQALIDHVRNVERQSVAEIVLVVSNVDGVEGLNRAHRAGIPTKVIPHKNFKSRVDFDMKVHEALTTAGVEYICLAGFMRILSAEFTQKWYGKILNVHPALLPSFKGANAHRQAIEAGVKISGCTVSEHHILLSL